MLKKVAVVAIPGMAQFEFGVICEVFGIDRSDMGGPVFDFHVVTADPSRPVPMTHGLQLVVSEGLDAALDADLIAIPAYTGGTHSTGESTTAEGDRLVRAFDDRVLELIRNTTDRGAWVLSVCSGAFQLAEAGVLDGRRATTHWMYADKLARRYPAIDVDPDVLFVEDGNVVTGAGTAAGIDAALHIVRKELGAAATNVIARRMVVPPQRDGGQSQYIAQPVPEYRSDSFAEVVDWMLENLDEDLGIDQLAKKALMSTRTFARRFRAEIGATPAAWLNRQRLLRAQQLLESSDLPLEHIAQQTGFGSAAVMRHHFVKVLQTSPQAYRRTFGALASA
ncbi:GlxA family transcriptional regulator [Herbiconiux sp. L3-i23]|uniref:GlxA family transcriptional regulator n=1 Tax=Herbiconiux sp. L3-i23 TaxID=2905871 RepID=UPI00205B900B|nr:helix-turn-helix domain-containing protein [Herbiconiux sp. L3-i23]BDI21673.1 putative transcription regulator, AraC family protein [Herbiconiux sp. L3-i23]